MEYTLEQRLKKIIVTCLNTTNTTDPVEIFNIIAGQEFVRIHGPEHHLVVGSCILTAFYNSGGRIDLKASLLKLSRESEKMPGAMCGTWGVCGAATSIGCALAVIDGTGPLSTDGSWGMHMQLCSEILSDIASTKGPRCCKRDGMLAITKAAKYINRNFDIKLGTGSFVCSYYPHNKQCIGTECPFWRR